MYTFLRIDTNILAAAFLSLVVFIASKRLDKNDKFNKLFIYMSLSILLILTLETLTCIINKRPELWLIPVSTVLHIFIFVLSPAASFAWYYFNRKFILEDSNINNISRIVFFAPIIINAVLVVLSPINHTVFYIDDTNVYHRGSYIIFVSLLTYFYMFAALFLIIRSRKKLLNREFFSLCLICVVPSIGSAVQVLFYGPLFIWSCTAFTLVIEYIFLQEKMVQIDGLTGAWTRNSFNYYLNQRIYRDSEYKFGIIYFDVDGLKKINDKFGHSEGDIDLIKAVEVVKTNIGKDDIIARLGGDEFAIIVNNPSSQEDLDEIIRRIKYDINSYNKRSEKKFKLSCSFGSDIYTPDFQNVDNFIRHVDMLMYNEKKTRR